MTQDATPPREPTDRAVVFDGPPLSLEEELAAARAEPEAGPDIDTVNESLADGLNRCPKCGSTDVRLRGSTEMLVCLFCRHQWQEARVEEEFGLGVGIDDLQGTVVAGGAEEISARRRRHHDDLRRVRCRRRGRHRARDERALPLVPPHPQRQPADAQRRRARRGAAVPADARRGGGEDPRVRLQATALRPPAVQEGVRPRERPRRLPALPRDRRPRRGGVRRAGRGADAALDREAGRQLGDLLRRRRLPRRPLGRLHRRRPDRRGCRGPRATSTAAPPTTSSTRSCRSTPRTP